MKEALWLKRFLTDLGITIPSVKIYGDNQGSIALSKNSVFHARSKHIDIQYHFIRDTVATGEILIEYLPTEYMVADIMTKPLPTEKHKVHTANLGVEM
jgi:kynurenine formamidase